MAAFATIAPGDEASMVERAPIAEPLELRAAEGVLETRGERIIEERFVRGDTIANLLERVGLEGDDKLALQRHPALRHLRPGMTVTVTLDDQDRLSRLDFIGARDRLTVLTRGESGFAAAEREIAFETRVVMKAAVVRSSLFAASDAAGIPDAIAIQIADIFGGDIDFHRDLRRGDRFTVVYESHAHRGLAVRSGRVLAAEFTSQGRTHRAVWYSGGEGDARKSAGYYAPDGKNLRKAFLRSPLEFSRISSGFGMRVHPFMKTWRAHRGVDYAAPAGTRVRTVGDGVVEFAGAQGGYGNVVIIRHAGQHSTLYAHLSGFGRGVKKGSRVAQGDIIGFVGRTGWATGTHLHYEFRIAGQARNPLAVVLPQAQPVPGAEITQFSRQAQPLLSRLDLIARGPVALLE